MKKNSKLETYLNLKQQLPLVQKAIITELMSLLDGGDGRSTVKLVASNPITGFSFLRTVKFSEIKTSWKTDFYLKENAELKNLQMILEASTDVINTLNNIVNYGNVSNLRKGEGGYSFFRKVSREHREIIKQYLGAQYSRYKSGAKKRNIHPK